MLDSHQLNVFLTAADLLNFTAAARQLHMTQPSVSQHIQNLEQHFETKLFVRSGRQLSLTEAGKELVPMARQMVSLSIHIDEAMESFHGIIHGHLRVGCSTTSGKYVLPLLLARFLKRHPKVQATCHVAPRYMAVEALWNGEIHLALACPHEFSKDVEFRKFIADPIVLVTPPGHPWAGRDEITPDELWQGEFIMREEGSGTKEVVANSLRDAGIALDDLKTVLTVGNAEAIALAVQHGIGVGFVSQVVVNELVRDGVCKVAIKDISMEQDVFIGQHTRHPATAAQAAFWRFVTDPGNPVLQELQQRGVESLVATSS